MAVTSFNHADLPAYAWAGPVRLDVSGTSYRSFLAGSFRAGLRLQLYATGTQLRVAGATGGAGDGLEVTVDGGAWTTITFAAGYATVFTGLTDTAHLVQIRMVAAATRLTWI